MSNENPKTFLYLAKWPDLTDSIVTYMEDINNDSVSKDDNRSDISFRAILGDVVPFIIGPLKIVSQSYVEILEGHGVDKKSDLESIIKAADDVKDVLPFESKRLLARFINEELMPELLNRGINVIGVDDD
jgi:hypothetical protein